MRVKTFINIVAFEAFFFGCIFFIMGGATGAGGFHVHHTQLSEYATRSVGALLICIGLTNWLLRNENGRILQSLLIVDLCTHALTGTLDVQARLSGMASQAAWIGVAVHACLAVGCIYYLVRLHEARDA